MSLHKEIKFEDEICEHLDAGGWLYAEKDGADFDRQLALFPADVPARVHKKTGGTIGLLPERHTALISAAVTGKIDVRDFAYQETP